MSHTTAIKAIKIIDTAALARAVTDLQAQGIKCSLVQDAAPRAYYENQAGMGKAPYVLKLDDAFYDIGFYPVKNAQGVTEYEARTDFFPYGTRNSGGTVSVESLLGTKASSPETREQAKLGKLFQAYGICAAENSFANQGKFCERQMVNGELQLVVNY